MLDEDQNDIWRTSDFGTFRDSLMMPAHRGEADIPPQGRDFRFRTSFWLWPTLASALVANDWTVELTGLITSRSQRKLAPGRRPEWGRTRAKGWPHNFDSRQLAFFTMLHL